MNRIEDDRVLFYLRHQQRIDEWAAIAKEASDAAHRFLCSCQDDIAALAAEFDPDVRPFVLLEEGYPKLFLCRSAWFSADKASKHPRAAIGLEWQRSAVNFSGRGKSPYIGVWVHYQMEGGSTLQNAISRAIRESGLINLHKLEASRIWWPAFRWEPAQGEFWADLSPYRAQLIDSVRFFWKTFEPLVRELVVPTGTAQQGAAPDGAPSLASLGRAPRG